MDTLYLVCKDADCTVTLPSPLDLSQRGVALVDIKGTIEPRPPLEEAYYLCCDFVQPSYVQGEDEDVKREPSLSMYPILRRITLKGKTSKDSDGKKVYTAAVSETFSKLLFLPVTRTPLDSFRLYIIDSRGKVPSFVRSTLKCTLLSIRYNEKRK